MSRHPNKLILFRSARAGTLWALVGLLIAVSQLNDSLAEATVGQQVFFWSARVLALVGLLFLAQWIVDRVLQGKWNAPLWLKPVVVVSASAILPFTAVELALEAKLPTVPAYDDQVLWAESPLLAYASEYVTLASVIIPLHFLLWVLLERRSHFSPIQSEAGELQRPAFLDKANGIDLPDIVAIKAEEHYVRVFAKQDSELLHYKFGDALQQLSEANGLQVHRSWWIADAFVSGARRGDRRWHLLMNGNIEVPVSDRYVKRVRARGHLKKKRQPGAVRHD